MALVGLSNHLQGTCSNDSKSVVPVKPSLSWLLPVGLKLVYNIFRRDDWRIVGDTPRLFTDSHNEFEMQVVNRPPQRVNIVAIFMIAGLPGLAGPRSPMTLACRSYSHFPTGISQQEAIPISHIPVIVGQ